METTSNGFPVLLSLIRLKQHVGNERVFVSASPFSSRTQSTTLFARVQQGQCDPGWVREHVSADCLPYELGPGGGELRVAECVPVHGGISAVCAGGFREDQQEPG